MFSVGSSRIFSSFGAADILSFSNLLSAIRTRKAKPTDIKVDDSVGVTSEVNKKGTSISEQIESGIKAIQEALAGAKSEKAPDNSLASISLALQSEFDYVEFDIWKTIDDQFVVSHDESLIDSCGVDVKVTELTLLQAMSYKIIYGKNSDVYLNEYIPSLEQILALAKDYPDKHLNIELKHVMSQEVLQKLLDLLIVYEMQDRVSILAFDQENIKTLRLLTASQKDVLSMQYLVNVPNDEVMQFCMDYNVGLGVKYNAISKSQIEILHQNGLMVNVWGVPNFYTVCYMVNNMNVDAITTDYMFFE